MNRLKRLAIYILSLMLVFSSLSISAYADNADGGDSKVKISYKE